MANMMNNSNSNKTNAKPTFKTGSPWDKTMEEQDEEKKLKEKKEKQAYQDRLDAYRKSIYDKLDDESKAFIDKEEADEKRKAENEKAKEADALLRKYNLGSFGQAYEDYVKDLLSVQKRAQNGEYIDKDTLTVLEQKGNGVLRMAGAYEKYLDLAGDKTGFKPVDDAKGSNLKALKDGIVGAIDLTKQYSKTFGKYETPEAYMADFDDMVYGEKYDGSSYADIQDAIGKTEGREKDWLVKNADSYLSSDEAQAEIDRIWGDKDKQKEIQKKIDERVKKLTKEYADSVEFYDAKDLEEYVAADKEIQRLVAERDSYQMSGDRLRELEQIKTLALRNEKYQEYQNAHTFDDFDELVAKGRAVKNPTNEEIVGYETAMKNAEKNLLADRTGLDENPVEIKNKLSYYKENPFGFDPYFVESEPSYTGYQELISEGKLNRHWDYLKPEEENTYYYLLAKDEEDGTNKADEYLDFMTSILNERAGSEIAKFLSDLPAVFKPSAFVLSSLASGLSNTIGGWSNAGASLSGQTVGTSALQYGTQLYKSTLPKPLQYLYGAGEMVGQLAPTMLLNTALGAVQAPTAAIRAAGALSIGTSSYGNAYKQAIDSGYSVSRAKTYGTLVGISEATLETLLGGAGNTLGVGEEVLVKNIKNAVQRKFGRAALIGAVKVGAEVAEEEIQAFLEPYFKTIIMNEEYDAPTVEELLETAIITMISTGILEGKSVIQEANLPSANVEEFGKRYNLDNSPATFLRALYADDSLISAKIIESVKEGNTQDAIKVLNEGIRNYKFAEEYMKYQFGKTGDLGTKISELESLKKAIAGGRFNAQAAKTALTKSSPVWEAAAGYNNTVVKGLLDGDISNKKIESTVLKNSATKAAFRRLTGIDVDAYGTLSAKRQVVKNTAEAYRTVTATPEYQEYLELAKKNETEKSTSAFTNNVKKMGDLMLSVQERLGYKGGRDTDAGKSTIPTVPQAINAVTHAAMAKAKDPLFFAGITSEVKTPSVDTETEQGSAGSTARELSFIESIESLAAEHLQGLDAKTVDMLQRASLEELLGKKGSLNEAEKQVIKVLDDQFMNADVHDKNGRKEAKEHNAKIQSQINSVKNFRRDAMTAIINEEASRFKASEKEVKDRIDYLQKFAKKRFGITIEGFDSGITYTDGKNVLTEKEYRDAKIRGETVHRYYNRGAFEKSTGVIRIARDLANGHVTVYDAEKGKFVTKRIGNGPGMISPKNAVDIVIMHEALHQASVGKDKQLVKDIVSYIADTEKDKAYEIGNRMAGREVSKDAQDRWDALKKTYINFEMSERNISAVEAKEIVNDLYLYEEIAADYMGSLLERQEMAEVLYAERPSLWRRIINALRDFFDKLGGNGARARAAQDFANRLEALAKKNYGRSNKILPKTDTDAKTRADSKTEGDTSEETELPLTNVEEGVVNTESGEPAIAIEGDGSVRASISTYEESGRDILSEYLNERVSDTGISEQDAADILSSLDEIYNICNGMKDEYETFGAWSEAKVETDENGNPVFSVIKANGEYAMNLDFSLVCKKRRALDAVFNRLVEMGRITDFDLGQEQIVKINDIIRDHGFEVACALCFVDAKRFRQAKVADAFVTMYNSLVRSLDKNKVGIDSFNFGGDQTVSPVENGIHTLPDSELDFTNIDKVLNGGKTGTVIYKIAQHLKDNPQDRRLVARGDFMSSEGFGEVKKRNPEILSLYNSKKGSAGPKSAFGDVQYLNDILSNKKFDVEKAYDVGGVRIQSFSDYVARLVFDYTQMVADLAAKGLPAHAYTKEVLFVKQFGLTGIKINMSLIPAIGDGRYAGLNADGSYAWAKESFPLDEAYAIQADAEYGKNCGTIAVGVSDVHIWKMLDDPAIRMVIPYHKSGINPIVAHMMNIDGFKNYTTEQNTRYRNGKKLNKADMSQVPDFNVLMHREGLNAVEASRRYVEWCEERGYLPKFHRFAYKTVNGERVFNENYYKLLEDFTTMVDGVYHPQEAVKMVFPNKDSAFGSMAELIRSGLEEDAVTAARLDADVDNIVNEIGEVLSQPVEVAPKKSTAKKGEVRYSVSDTLDSDLDSILDGSFEASRNELYLGETSNFMTDVIGADSLSLYMPASKAYSSLVTREEYEKKPYYSKQNHYHGIGKKDFIEILEKSEAPIAAFADTADSNGNERNNRIVLVTDKIIKNAESKKDGYAVVIEEVDSVGRSGGKSFRANKAITFYSIDQIEHDLSLALDDGRLLDINKKGEHLLNMRRGGNSQATIQKGVLKNNIAHFWANVKWKNAKNKKMSTGPDNLPTEMQRALEKAGYQQQYTQNGQKGSNRGSVSEEIGEDTIQEDMQKAYDHFGTTTSFEQTGFVDGEGRMLKLSQYGLSGVNHGRIGEIYDNLKGSEAVNRFIQEGNVRIKATSPGIEIGEKAINTRQMNAISRFISNSLAKKGYFYLDITGRDGNTIASVEYDDDASAEDVLYDIKAYYERGRVPKNQTRYSVSEEMDAEYFDALDRGDEAALERIVEETARAAGYNTPRLFHGTQKFGFTDIDVSKSDDQVTVFATANEEVARTYTHHGNDPVKGERRLVSDQPIMSYEEFDALPEKELLPYVKEYLGKDFKAVPLSEATKAAREFLKITRQRLIELTEEKAKGLTKRNLRNRLRDAITALSEVIASKNTYTYSDAQNEYYNKLANLTREKGDVVREATKIMSQAEWAINMIPVTYEDYTYENPYEDKTLWSNGKIVYDVEEARNEVKKLLFKGIYSFYGKLTNPLVVDGKGAAWSQIDGAYIGEKGKKVSTRDVALYAKEHGYDGVIYKKIIDNNVREEGLGASDVYAFFVESALKSADPVTYDNDGNVIPPSERFNPETNDIRRSVSEELVEDEALSYEGELKEIDRKRAENEAFVSSFISTNANRGLTVTTVRDMLADTISAFDGEAKSDDIYAIKEEFDRFFEYAVDGKLHERDENGKWLPKTTKVKKPDPKKASELLDTVAEKILDVTLGLSEDRREMQDALKYLRGAKIHITQDVRNAFGDKWNEFRTKAFGTLDFRRDEGGDVSAIYEEMCAAFPELFDGTAKTVSEQLQQMYQVGEDVRLALRQGKGYTIDEKSVIQDIVTYLGQKLSEMSPETLYHYHQNLSTKEYYRNRIRKIREEYESRIKNIREYITNRSEVQEARYQKKRVEKQGKELAKRLAKPSKDKHIMVDYEADVLNLLNRITWSEQTKVNRDVGAAVKGYLAMLENRKGPKIGDPVDGVGFSESLKADIKEFKFKPLDDMDSAELHKLNELLRRATFEVNNADKLFRSNESASVVATRAIEEFQSARAIHTDKGKKEIKEQWFRDLLDDSVDPETFFHNLGVQELTDAFNRIADDQNVYANDLRTFAERMQEIVGEKGVPTEWREKAIDITTERGNTIKATPAQLMSIYLLSRQEDSRKCLLSEYGGAVFAGVEQHGKVLGGVKRQTINDNVYLLTEGDLDMFEAVLTNEVPEAKAVADKISELLNTIVSEKANETSLAIEGYRKYTKSNYFPMMVFGGKSTSSTDVDVHLGKLFSSIITEGFSRDRTDNTNKKMLIADIFSVVDKHLLGVAAYHAYKADAINMNKIMYTRGDNGISLVDRISLAEGAKGSRYVRYLDNFLLAVQNGQMESNEATEFTEKAFRHYKAAAVAANMSVVAKQPISIIRALPEFSNKTALKMLLTFEGANSKTLREEMIRHSGLAQMKAWGFSENANARSFNQLYDKNAISMKERLDNATSHFAEEADMATWTRIWVACKAETKTLEEATKKFNEVIRKTQVVNTVTTASAASNRKGLAQFLFAFKNEPLKSFNYLRAAIHDARIGKQGAGVHLFKVATSSLLNTALVAAITTMFTMFRDEEEEDMETFGKLFLKNSLNDILGNLTIFAGDVATSVYDVLTGDSQGAVERLDLAGVLDFAQDCKRIADMIGTDELDRRDTWAKAIYNLTTSFSRISGVPVGNVLRDVRGIGWSVANMTDDPMVKYKITAFWYNVYGSDNGTVKAKFRDILTDALDDGNYKGFDKVQKELRSKGFGTNEISKAVAASDTLYEAWCEGPAVLRAELAKAKEYTEILRYEDVVSSLASRKTSLVTDLYDAVRLGDKEAEEAAREALLNHRDAKTMSKLREYEVKDLLESKYNSSINEMIKDKFTGVERGGAAYNKAMSLVLAEFKHFGVTEQEVKRRIANLSIRFS